jgi:hypothetical protein
VLAMIMFRWWNVGDYTFFLYTRTFLASLGLSLTVLPDPGSPFSSWQVQHVMMGVNKTLFALTRLAMAMVKTRRIVAVPRATRSPGRVVTRLDREGSQ